jgi:hypothetical protein
MNEVFVIGTETAHWGLLGHFCNGTVSELPSYRHVDSAMDLWMLQRRTAQIRASHAVRFLATLTGLYAYLCAGCLVRCAVRCYSTRRRELTRGWQNRRRNCCLHCANRRLGSW